METFVPPPHYFSCFSCECMKNVIVRAGATILRPWGFKFKVEKLTCRQWEIEKQKMPGVMYWMFVSPQVSHIEILTPSVMASGGDLVMRVEPSWMKFLPFLKEPQRATLPLLTCKDAVRRKPSKKQEASSHQTPYLLVPCSCTFQSPTLWEINFCCLYQ